MNSNRPMGYAGKLLRVDLSTEHLIDEVPDEVTLRHYIGGRGIGIKCLYEEVPLQGAPLSGKERSVFMCSR